jgi:hypothetical protein
LLELTSRLSREVMRAHRSESKDSIPTVAKANVHAYLDSRHSLPDEELENPAVGDEEGGDDGDDAGDEDYPEDPEEEMPTASRRVARGLRYVPWNATEADEAEEDDDRGSRVPSGTTSRVSSYKSRTSLRSRVSGTTTVQWYVSRPQSEFVANQIVGEGAVLARNSWLGARAKLYVTALVSIAGSMLFWTGLWDVLDLFTFTNYDGKVRDGCFAAVGLVLMCVTGTFVSSSGLDLPNRYDVYAKREGWLAWTLFIVTTLASLLGQVVLSLGVYNLVDVDFVSGQPPWYNGVCLGVGILVVLATRTVFYQAGLDVVADKVYNQALAEEKPESSSGWLNTSSAATPQKDMRAGDVAGATKVAGASPQKSMGLEADADGAADVRAAEGNYYDDFCEMLEVHVRAALAIVGGLVLWKGTEGFDDLRDSWLVDHGITLGYPAVFDLLKVAVGFTVLYLTRACFGNAGIADPDAPTPAMEIIPTGSDDGSSSKVHPRLHDFAQYLRAALAYFGTLITWDAAWNLLAYDGLPVSPWRDLGYIIAGLVLMWLCGTLWDNAGVTPLSWGNSERSVLEPFELFGREEVVWTGDAGSIVRMPSFIVIGRPSDGYHDITKPFPDSTFTSEAEETAVDMPPSAAAPEKPLFTAPDEDLEAIREDESERPY